MLMQIVDGGVHLELELLTILLENMDTLFLLNQLVHVNIVDLLLHFFERGRQL